MALPDVVVNVRSAAASRSLPTDTGTGFMVGITERGPTDGPRELRSLQQFIDTFGARLTTSPLYDAVETYFAEGGARLLVSRVFGAGAVAAAKSLLDVGAAISLVVTAGQATPASAGGPGVSVSDPGTWGNSLTVQVIAGAAAGEFVLIIFRNAVEVERSPSLVDTAAAIAWARANSRYVTISQGASLLDPAVAAASALTGGTDGAAVADADWQGALDRTVKDLGPGQVAAPGRTTSAGQLQLLDHAQQRNRFAILDGADTVSDTTLVAAAQALYVAPNNGRRYGQLLAPWDVVPGLTPTTLRTVPPSARAMAQYSRVDALGNPNQAAAGRNGRARFAVDLSQPAWTDAQRLSLNNAGVTVSRRRYGNVIATYGMRSMADQSNDAQWSMAPNVRCVMAFVSQALVVGEEHEFDQVDGQGQALAQFRGELIAKANALYLVGALYGATPAEAFYVDTGPAINPVSLLALGEMHAQVALRTSPSAERVIIDVVKTPITQAL